MNTLIEQLILLMNEKGLSQSDVAKAIGMSPATVSNYLNGTYKGDVNKVNDKIAAYLRLEENRRQEAEGKTEYVRTQSGRRIADILRLAHATGNPVVIIGQAGLGKTSALYDYHAQNPDTLLVESDPTYNAKVLLAKLAKSCGVPTDGSLNLLMERLTERLKDSGRLIMIDEAENLPLKALECVRRLHDKTDVGLALVGMPRLLTNLRGRYGELKQLSSRVNFKLDLGDALDDEELTEIVVGNLKTEDAAVVAELVAAAEGNVRRLVKMLHGVRRLARRYKEPVNVQMVRQFREMLIR